MYWLDGRRQGAGQQNSKGCRPKETARGGIGLGWMHEQRPPLQLCGSWLDQRKGNRAVSFVGKAQFLRGRFTPYFGIEASAL